MIAGFDDEQFQMALSAMSAISGTPTWLLMHGLAVFRFRARDPQQCCHSGMLCYIHILDSCILASSVSDDICFRYRHNRYVPTGGNVSNRPIKGNIGIRRIAMHAIP